MSSPRASTPAIPSYSHNQVSIQFVYTKINLFVENRSATVSIKLSIWAVIFFPSKDGLMCPILDALIIKKQRRYVVESKTALFEFSFEAVKIGESIRSISRTMCPIADYIRDR